LSIRNVGLLALTVTSGATDAIGFLALGGVFASVMTGNMVLLGISGAETDAALAGHAAAAIGMFIAGNALGVRLAGRPLANDANWPRSITRALWVEAIPFGGYAILWWLFGGHPGTYPGLGCLALIAVGLGIQSTAVQRFGHGLSSTYLTSTLIAVVVGFTAGEAGARRGDPDVALRVRILIALIGGAAVSALLVEQFPMFAPLLPLAGLAAALVAAHPAGSATPSVAEPP
jgi:uncharacterized membrane protein YoaK (UPF0700 family)